MACSTQPASAQRPCALNFRNWLTLDDVKRHSLELAVALGTAAHLANAGSQTFLSGSPQRWCGKSSPSCRFPEISRAASFSHNDAAASRSSPVAAVTRPLSHSAQPGSTLWQPMGTLTVIIGSRAICCTLLCLSPPSKVTVTGMCFVMAPDLDASTDLTVMARDS